MENNVNKETYLSIITSIITGSSARVEGVASIGIENGSIMDKFSFKTSDKGIEIEINNNQQVIATIAVNVKFGYKMPELISRLQDYIKKEVESTTCYKVKSININVVGVTFPS